MSSTKCGHYFNRAVVKILIYLTDKGISFSFKLFLCLKAQLEDLFMLFCCKYNDLVFIYSLYFKE